MTIAAALRAGQVMRAQIEGSPSEDGGAEAAPAGAVRPQLGNGEPSPEAEPEPDASEDTREDQPSDAGPTSDAGAQAYASTPKAFASGGEPSGGPGIVFPAPADVEAPSDGSQPPPAESVSAPSDTGATPTPDSGIDEAVYGPTGPVSNTGGAPTSAATGSPEDGDDGYEQPSPHGGVPDGEPNAVPEDREGESAEAEPTVEETGPTSGDESRSILVPVSPSVEEETDTTEGNTEPVDELASTVSPADASQSENASVESPPPEETPEDASTETDTPSTTSTEPSADEPDEEHVEIVVVVDGAPQTDTPVETPPEQPATEQLPAGQARPEEVAPSEAPPVQEPFDGEDPSEGGTLQDDDTDQGRSPSEEAPYEEEPTEQPPASEEPAEDQPGDVPPDEERLPTDGEPASTGGTGPRDGAPMAPPEDLRPGGERPEDPEGAAILPPDDESSEENPNDTSKEDGTPTLSDQVSGDPREGGRDERQEEDLRKKEGSQEGEGGPEVRPSVAGKQVEENGGGGEPVQEKPQNLTVAPEEGIAIQQEQTVIVEVGGDSSPEPLAQDAPRTTEESVAADPAPQAAPAPVPTRTEEPTPQQDAVEQARADRRFAPEPDTVDRTPVPEDTDGSPEGSSGRRGDSSGSTEKP